MAGVDPVTEGLTVADDALKLGQQLQTEANTPAQLAQQAAQEAQNLKDKVNADIAAEIANPTPANLAKVQQDAAT